MNFWELRFIPLDYYLFVTLLNFATCIFLSIFVFIRNPRSNLNKVFSAFCLAIAQWSFFYFLWLSVKEDFNKKVFTPFFTTKTSSHKGTGLGLYVIKKIITDNHKGRVSFESAYKVGTRFIVELPLA